MEIGAHLCSQGREVMEVTQQADSAFCKEGPALHVTVALHELPPKGRSAFHPMGCATSSTHPAQQLNERKYDPYFAEEETEAGADELAQRHTRSWW